jgi:hypothetical protein
MFFLQQNWRTRGKDRFCLKAGVAQIMYIHVTTCKNNKIKLKKKSVVERIR